MRAFDDKGVLLIRMNPEEALKTIESLARQIQSKDSNDGRYEEFLDDGRDFSIAVEGWFS